MSRGLHVFHIYRRKLLCAALLCLLAARAFAAGQAVDVPEAAAAGGMVLYWDPLTQSGTLQKNERQISFRAGDDFVLQDYSTILLEKAPYVEGGRLLASPTFMKRAENFFLSRPDGVQYRVGAILLDPGHGGKDPGASAQHVIRGRKVTLREKDINLSVGLKLYDQLKKAYPDKKILMTRNTDTFISLEDRTKIANSIKLAENEAILYVSIHVNSSLDKSASGFEVWYLSPGYNRQVIDHADYDDQDLASIINDIYQEEYLNESIMIANFITEGLSAQVGEQSASRGTKAEEWFVVRNANMPSVLVEIGFLTNAEEAALLDSDDYLQKLSLGIYNGLQAFITHFELTKGFTGTR